MEKSYTFENIIAKSSEQIDLPSNMNGRILSIKEATRCLEQELIKRALRRIGGNRTQGARMLGISRPILISRIKKYDLWPEG